MLTNRKLTFIFLIVLLFFGGVKLSAQKRYVLNIKASDKTEQKIISRIKYNKKFPSATLRDKEIRKVMMQLYAESYAEAQIDSMQNENLNQTVFISLHEKYKWKQLRKGNLSPLVIDDIGFQEKIYNGKVFNYHHFIEIEESIIKYYETHGYPFASISLDSINIDNHEISAAFQLTKGPLIHIDTVLISGFTKIHPKYIYRLIDIKPGDVYNETKIQNINRQLGSMLFAQESKAFSVSFSKEEAVINIQLKKEDVNIFDGIIGFQPNSGVNNQLMLTGNLRLKLINSFKRGELIDINWRSPEGGSQYLNLHIAYPYLFNSPIGINYKFSLRKQDSSFINLRNQPGISFIINGLDYIKISANIFSSQTLSTTLVNNKPLNQDFLDLHSSIFNLELNLNRLNYIYNPRKGWLININGGYGLKDIIKQHDIDDSFYDSIPLHSNQMEFGAHLEYFIPIFRRQTIRLANKSALIKSDYLLENELYRIGGFSDLRGFNEESIYASSYSIFTLEWRFLLEQNSYINIFWNGAYVEKSIKTDISYDQPMGFGAGISFQTKAGIFALSYALGRQNGNPIDFSSAKIHFGYMARF